MRKPCGHYTLDQRRNVVQNDVMTLFQLHFNVVPTSDARWEGSPDWLLLLSVYTDWTRHVKFDGYSFAGFISAFTLSASTRCARIAEISFTANAILLLLILDTKPHAGLTQKKSSDWLISLSRFYNYRTNSNTCSCRCAVTRPV